MISYRGESWHDFHSFALLAASSVDFQSGEGENGWLGRLSRAFVQKVEDQVKNSVNDESETVLRDVYLSLVCLRDLVKVNGTTTTTYENFI